MTDDSSPEDALTAPEQSLSETALTRQAERLRAAPALYQTKHERLAYELALRMEPAEEVFQRYGYDEAAALALMESPAFAGLLDRVAKDVQENGLSFKAKARAQAEDLLAHSYDLATDPLCSAAVRADLIKWTAKVAGLEPTSKDTEKTGGGGLTLNISFAGQPAQAVIAHDAVTIEQK